MGMESGSGLSVADALALQDRNDDGMFGGNGMWVFFLFFLLAWGNGGWGFGNRGEQPATSAEVQRGFDNQNVMNKLNGLENGLCDGFYAQNTTMLQGFNGIQRDLCQGFNGVNNGIAESRFAAQQCCCETNRNIDAVRYENARNTCDIVNAIKADGDATRALMTQNTIQELRDQLQAAQLQLGNLSQTRTIIDAVRPFPSPAYITCSPYTAVNGYGCGCGNGCGC